LHYSKTKFFDLLKQRMKHLNETDLTMDSLTWLF